MQVENANGAVKGKAASTKFTRISTDGTHSIVLCEPITGRTHQVRNFDRLKRGFYIICSNILREISAASMNKKNLFAGFLFCLLNFAVRFNIMYAIFFLKLSHVSFSVV